MLNKSLLGIVILSLFSCEPSRNELEIHDVMEKLNDNYVVIDKLDHVNKGDSGNYTLKQSDTLNKGGLKSDEADKLMEIIENDKR